MSGTILYVGILLAQGMLAVAMLCAAVRILRGPRAQDRVLAMDTLYVNSMLFLITMGIRTGSVFFFEASLIIGVLGFVSTLALAKFLMRGEVIE